MQPKSLDGLFISKANSWLKRLVGLLGHSSLSDNSAMLFEPGGSIHTIGMRFAIDVIYLDKQNKVLKIVTDMKSFRFSIAPKGTRAVLELASGNAKRTGIYLDQTLVFG
ncbi:hypothetical protein A9Q99_04395 [Gammaproteobacteria bacterium 45_16_T64]|nr:hypothetical protein A9Q99_04395 [Gammaproteobacteria bacterium 45_16_T64]